MATCTKPKVRRISLTQGKYALVDDKDYKRLKKFKWSIDKKATDYAVTKVTIYMHRMLVRPKPGLVVDHINRNGLDNRRKNLRVVTYSMNLFNSKIHKNNTSGVRGLSFSKARQKWEAQLQFNGRRFRKRFASLQEATNYRRQLELSLTGELCNA